MRASRHNSQPVLIDPAVHYGHRETEITFTKLFGGFNKAFYDIYNEEFPMEKEWEERVKYHNLYPLLVHLNSFGKSYLKQVEEIINPFCRL
ncbi:MAG: protein-ribulosamine 3-kinase [Sphingobacteriales bacterium]|jgi:protein-ribulosamine 3-kinase